MKYSVLLLLLSVPAWATRQSDLPINTSGELLGWCQQASQAELLGRGLKPFNWTASHWDDAESLYVKGSWRNGTKEVIVECHVGRGARSSYTVMSMHDK